MPDIPIGVVPLILAGGSGSRLWPLSRAALPKQLLPLVGEKTLLQCTLERVAGFSSSYKPLLIVCDEHRYLARRQLMHLGLLETVEIIVEPLGRSTAPAICGAAHLVSQKYGRDALMLVLPSDHLMENEAVFRAGVCAGMDLARKGNIVTFGIRPDRVETGYGYIEQGENGDILSFKEKPPETLARSYVQSENYLWNSGIFLFQTDSFLQEMAYFCPEITQTMELAVAHGRFHEGFFRFDAPSMRDVEDVSIDYALLEKTGKAKVVPVDPGWRDLGSWFALWQEQQKDTAGNVVHGDVLSRNVRNSYVWAGDKLAVLLGVEQLLLVESGDALLVAALPASQQVKTIAQRLRSQGREEWLNRNFSSRSWGWYRILAKAEHSIIRKVVLYPGMRQMLQKHMHRSEHWVVVSGTARIRKGQELLLLHENQSCVVPAGVSHCIENPGVIPLHIIEIQVGFLVDDNDVLFFTEEEDGEE